MYSRDLEAKLRFYFITDEAAAISSVDQVRLAIAGGATMIQYRNKSRSLSRYDEASEIKKICRQASVPFIVNDDVLLAKAMDADGVHIGQGDDKPELVRRVMGEGAIIGVSVSSLQEFFNTPIKYCDYIGAGPVFSTGTKKDASPVIGCDGLSEICRLSPLPVVAIGGITPERAGLCIECGASGVCMISAISRAVNPELAAKDFASALGIKKRLKPDFYADENSLLKDVLRRTKGHSESFHMMMVAPGDDACLLKCIERPVISTDSHVEDVHFRRSWQSLYEIGRKAVSVCLSDLAASYARPVAIFINLGLPDGYSGPEIRELYEGIQSALEEYGGCIGGGNISRNRKLAVELFCIGEGGPVFPLRSGARSGRVVCSTGFLGLSRCGLYLNSLPLSKGMKRDSWKAIDSAFRNPKARFDASKILERHGVCCVMDISDGLAADAFRMAESSGVTIELQPDLIPIHPEMSHFCRETGLNPLIEALEGGEDYELLFSCEEKVFEEIRKELSSAFIIGSCKDFSGSNLVNLPLGIKSFDHLK